MGIYDPISASGVTRAHTDTPTSSQLARKRRPQDDLGRGDRVQQLTPWGGTVNWACRSGNRTNQLLRARSTPLSSGLSLAISQPLLRNFGPAPDRAQHRDGAQHPRRVVPARPKRPDGHQCRRAVVLGPRLRPGNLAVKIEARDIAAEINRITKIKIDVGSLAPIDIVQTEVGIATAEQDIINAQAVVGLAEDQLRRNMNYQAATPQRPRSWRRTNSTSERHPFDLAAGVTNALERRPEIHAQNSAVASNELRFEFWQNQTLPQLDLVAGYGKNGLSGIFFNPEVPGQVVDRGNWWDAADQLFSENFKSWRVGLVFSYPILNRAAKGARGVAKYNLETSKSQLTVLEQDIVLDVRNAHRAIETANLQIDAAAKGQELAERNLDAARKKYDNGMTTSFEVSQIQSSSRSRSRKYLHALALYRKAVCAYHNSIADILNWKGITIDGIPPHDEGPIRTTRWKPRSLTAGVAASIWPRLDGRRAPAHRRPRTGPDSALGRVVGVFVSPVRTFGSIAAKPTWLLPVAIATCLALPLSELILSKTDWHALITERMAHSQRTLSESQTDAAVEQMRRLSWVWDVLAVVVPLGVTAAIAGIVWASCQAFGWEVRFAQSMGLTAHAFLPGTLKSIGLLAVLWNRASINPDLVGDALPSSLGFLVGAQDRVLHGLLSSLDLFSFWDPGAAHPGRLGGRQDHPGPRQPPSS